ncbi:MAG: Heme/hemopexin-binding protein [Candidatus Anoxychlamydiales bacterium]|nr:Heme/hemopexin-binding protein [Candidatus Anoxychlamydiales bacterium]
MKKLIFIYLFLIFVNVYAAPKSPNIISGDVLIKDNLLIKQNSLKAIIDWDSFSLLENETINFNQISKNASILNRVTSSDPSNIFGKINANGAIYLVNKNGIVFSKNSSINVSKFIATTLDIDNTEFLNNKIFNLSSDNNSSIMNSGKIFADREVILLSNKVINKGKISSNNLVMLIGANDVILNQEGDKSFVKLSKDSIGSIENLGTIKSLNTNLIASDVDIYSLAINQEGIIDTTDFEIKDGEIILTANSGNLFLSGEIKSNNIDVYADNIEIKNSLIDISNSENGHISIGKNNEETLSKSVYIDPNSKIIADSYSENINKVIILSEDKTDFNGEIFARGLGEIGDGGFIEISSKNKLIAKGKIHTNSINGKKGKVLFDPGSVHIQKGDDYDLGYSAFNDRYINELLKTSNVEISTLNSNLEDTQTITIDGDVNISWKEATTLSFLSNKDIIFKSGSIIENIYEENFLAIDIKTNKQSGNYKGVVLEKGATLLTKGGNIKIEAIGGNIENSNIGLHLQGRIESTNEDLPAGNIDIIGNVGRAENNNFGIFLDSGSIISKNGNVNILAISEATQESNHGIYLANLAKIHLDNSNLNIEGIGSGTNSSGVYISKAQIKGINDSNIKISGQEAGSYSLYLTTDAYILSDSKIELVGNSIFTSAQIESKQDIFAQIGKNSKGKLVLKKTIYGNLVINGGAFENIFNIDCSQKCFIDGISDNNTIMARDINNQFVFDGLNSGSINKEIIFSNISNFMGSRFNDDKFIFLENGKINGFIDGVYGSNTIKGSDKNNVFIISSLNEGKILDTANFKNIQNLSGGNKNDTFIFENFAKLTGVINGNGGLNSIDYSKNTSPLVIDLHKIMNISQIVGGDSENTLLGPESENIWKITNEDEGYVNNIKFYHIDKLVGSDLNDKFYILEDGSLTGYIDGNKGYNYLFASDINNTWYITKENEGYIDDVIYFKNINNLFGNQKTDFFTFIENGKISGIIDGNSSNGNIIDYSSYINEVVLDLNKVSNIQNIIGNDSTTLFAKDINNVFNISSIGGGTLNNDILFSSIKNIIGGSKDDTFIIEKTGMIDGFFDGKEGVNTIAYKSDDDTNWNINSLNSGLINDLITFKNIQNLQGSDGSDKFVFTNDGMISGKIDGRGVNNILDFSLRNSAATIELNKIDNVSKIIGSNYLDVLVGKDKNNIWDISGINSGKIGEVEFINIENLKGGSYSDIFKFNDLSKMSGIIDGGNDLNFMNLLDYSNCQSKVEANILTNSASNTGSINNIQAVVLPDRNRNIISKDINYIEIPLNSLDISYNKLDDPILNELIFNNFDVSNPLLDLDLASTKLSIYISQSDNKTLVYRTSSSYIITKDQVKTKFAKASLSPYVAGIIVADDGTRMKNNLNVTIKNRSIPSRGSLNKVDTVYDTDESGMDLDGYTIVKSKEKDRLIKNKPRSLRYRPKKVKK